MGENDSPAGGGGTQGGGTQGESAADPSRPSRREVLAGLGTASLAGLAAVLATRALDRAGRPRAAASPGPVQTSPPLQPAGLIGKPGPPSRHDWAAVAAQLSSGQLLRPGDHGYARGKLLFEPRFDHLEPAGLAYCRTAADVATCLSFGQRYSLPVRVRSGGHSYAGWSSVSGGLVIDVSQLDSFSVSGQTVRVGTGLDLISFYDQLGARGLSVPAGSCPTVGLAGLTLGGGVGVLSRLQGVTSDNLESAQVVTADGSILDCDPAHHSDLLWACRGGGGGNFGVATSFTFHASRLDTICVFFLTWPWTAAARVLRGWQDWAPDAPDALWSNLHLSSEFGGTPAVSASGAYAGTRAGAARHLDRLLGRTGPAGSYFLRGETYRDVMLLEAGCSSIPASACHTGPGGRLPRVPSYAKSDFFDRKLNAAGIAVMLAGIEQTARIRGAAGGAGTIALDACGGAMNRISPAATAFAHRDALFLAQYSTIWNWPGTRSRVASQYSWLRSCYAAVHPHASGQAYQNYVDPDLPDWERAYYGANYPRLQQVKRTYDPAELFRFPQSVRPA